MKKEYSKGFTLLEIIVALAIMATAVIVLIQLFGTTLRLASTSNDYNTAICLAGNILENTLNKENLESNYEKKDFIDGQHKWEVKALDYPLPELSQEIETPMKMVQVIATVWWKGKKIELSTLKLISK